MRLIDLVPPASCHASRYSPDLPADAAMGPRTNSPTVSGFRLGSDVLAWLGVEELLTLERAEVIRPALVFTLARHLLRIDALGADRIFGHRTVPLRRWLGAARSLLPAG